MTDTQAERDAAATLTARATHLALLGGWMIARPPTVTDEWHDQTLAELCEQMIRENPTFADRIRNAYNAAVTFDRTGGR
jgi:hypothetical protein